MDVTEQELLTQVLRREQAYLTDAQSMAHIGSWAYNLVTQKLLHSSDENARLYGFDPSQGPIPAERFFDTQHAEDAPYVNATLERAVREGTDFYLDEYRIHHTDGSIRFLRAIGHRNASGEPGEYVGVTMDITDRKRADAERKKAEDHQRELRAKLARTSRIATVAELSASIAHELNQPLTSVMANAQGAQRWLSNSPPNLSEAMASIERVVRDGRAADARMQQIRALFKKEPFETKEVRVSEMVGAAIRLIHEDSSKPELAIDCEIDQDLPSVMVDPIQIQEVLSNLLSNAIEAMTNDVRPPHLKIRAHRVEDAQVLVEVMDNGLGLDETEQIFDPFVTTKDKGMGIGLAVSRSIIEAHDGQLWAQNNPDGGATFTIKLPVASERASARHDDSG